MATINKRGPYQFQVIVRRKGYPSQTKTFETRADAATWARSVESSIDNKNFRDRRVLVKFTLHEALERYLTTVTAAKRGCIQERNRLRQIQKHPLALRYLDSLLAKDFAAYRDERLLEVGPTSVRLELALLSHLYTIAIKEWSWPLTHELKNVRKPPSAEGRERRLQTGEEARLFEAIQTITLTRSRVWLDACVRLAIETGMRAGEILTCTWSQVELRNSCIRLSLTKNGSKRIYQALYIQGRGALKRELVSYLRMGRALRVPRARAQAKAWAHVSEEVMLSRRPSEAENRAVPGH